MHPLALLLALASPGATGVAVARGGGRAARGLGRAGPRMTGADLLGWLARADAEPSAALAARADGLLALARDVPKGEVLLGVPTALQLSEASLRANVVGSFLDGWPMASGEPGAIALALLHEAFLGGSSAWAGYLEGLPRAGEGSLDVPLLWSEAERAEFAASTTLPVDALVASIASDYEWLRAGPFAEASDLFPPKLFSPERFKWAYAVALSRGVRLGETLMLVPGVGDVARAPAGRGANAAASAAPPGGGGGGAFSFNPFARAAATPAKAARTTLVTTAAIVAGTPLALAADLSPSESLWAHGTLPAGRAGECELRLAVAADDRLREDKADVLERNGLKAAQLWTLRSGALSREELLKYMRLVSLQGARSARDAAAQTSQRARARRAASAPR
jgi:hypothetical protein